MLLWLMLAAITYIAAWLVVPDPNADGTVDFVAHFEANRAKFFGTLLAWMVGGAVLNGHTPSLEAANMLVPLFLVSFATAMLWKHPLAQLAVLVLSYAAFIYYALNFIPEL